MNPYEEAKQEAISQDDPDDMAMHGAHMAMLGSQRVTLDGVIIPTYATEGELNGWRASQGSLLDRAAYRVAPARPMPAGALLL